MQHYDRNVPLAGIKEEFTRLGYVGGLLHENYEFADILSPGNPVRRIPLAAFTQEPPSYRSASFGVALANGRSGQELIHDNRSLGAPQLFEINDDRLFHWKVASDGAPSLLNDLDLEHVPKLFAEHRDEWGPQRILSATPAGMVPTQLDFPDLGLLPLLDNEVRKTLDRLLQNTVAHAIATFETSSSFTEAHYQPLFRLVFRLLAAKLLADGHHPGNWLSDDPQLAIRAVEDFYRQGGASDEVLSDPATQRATWDLIRNTFHFQNVSVDVLAYVYETTLVARDDRKLFGIHSTPFAIADYIVSRLPFEALVPHKRRVFEPFAGHSVFLVAAMQRMRALLPASMTLDERHWYFVDMLSGIEIDDFAREVGKLSLMLADYPNPDGWRLYGGDAFVSPQFEEELKRADVVLCNPPFEAFTADERSRYDGRMSASKPAEILRRVLETPPALLGMVLPRTFWTGRGYKSLKTQLANTYSTIEVLALPDRVFQHSDTETVLLIAYGYHTGTLSLRTGEVRSSDLNKFYSSHQPSHEVQEHLVDVDAGFVGGVQPLRLRDVWQATSDMRRLGDIADIHRGIEYKLPSAKINHY